MKRILILIGTALATAAAAGVLLLMFLIPRQEEAREQKEAEELTRFTTAAPVLASALYETEAPAEESEAEEERPQISPEEDDGEARSRAEELLICIDPGHYTGANAVKEGVSYGYNEGDVTLKIATALQEILWERYGIDSYLTRTGPHITLGGYTDKELDKSHIALRGAYAALYQCDLFVSLHTNANGSFANGAATYAQPEAINKPLILVNETGSSSEETITVCNDILKQLSSVYRSLGLPGDSYEEAACGALSQWTKGYNDGIDLPGRVLMRTGTPKEGSDDYYGVLRGAANKGIPGIIIEHGFHTVPTVRRLAMEEDLIYRWAEADAAGIAEGFGCVLENP